MVQAPDIAQLCQDCHNWRENLRNSRSEIGELKHRLQEVAAKNPPKELLTDVEHYHNQFYIQLINIHDLKHAVKDHEHKLHGKEVTDELIGQHDRLYQEYQNLENIISELRSDFHVFLSRTP
jgi:5-methylcytosine-specific restriction endonuclease McrBC GTP-binding regulatory subunit McrB